MHPCRTDVKRRAGVSAKIRGIGYGVPSDFELNFGRYLPALGRTDDNDTDTQPD